MRLQPIDGELAADMCKTFCDSFFAVACACAKDETVGIGDTNKLLIGAVVCKGSRDQLNDAF